MKKYYQAALVLTATVSLISLLLYRHEYNKLRYILEVFNYFGKPGQNSLETNCTNNFPVFAKLNMRFEEPISAWQRLDDDLYAYSAYSIYEKEIHVIGFGKMKNIHNIHCIIFFENEVKPFLGKFKYLPINGTINTLNLGEESNYSGYYFICTHGRNKVPVGVTFFTKSIHFNDASILPVKVQPQSLNHGSFGVCVMQASSKPIHELEMISFLNFHDLIGMENFIIYDYGIPNTFNSRLKEMAMAQNPYWKFTYTVLPWNFPFTGISYSTMKNIIEADCLYRTYNKVMYAITLSWEEYLVLKYHHSPLDLMGDFNRSRLTADRYKLTTLTFCTQQKDNKESANSTLTVLKKTYFDKSIESDPTYIYKPVEALMKSNIYTRDIGQNLVTLNRYKYCDNMNRDAYEYDPSILRFNEDIQNSPIYKRFITESKFSPDRNLKI